MYVCMYVDYTFGSQLVQHMYIYIFSKKTANRMCCQASSEVVCAVHAGVASAMEPTLSPTHWCMVPAMSGTFAMPFGCA